jgi:hypothetical protein
VCLFLAIAVLLRGQNHNSGQTTSKGAGQLASEIDFFRAGLPFDPCMEVPALWMRTNYRILDFSSIILPSTAKLPYP